MEKFYTVKELEEILKVNSPSIRQYIKDGKLKACRFGGKKLLIKESDLKAFIK